MHVADSLAPSLTGQAEPVPAWAEDTTYVRDFAPVSHVAEQDPQLPHDPTQSTGHTCVLHACDSLVPSLTLQAVPPFISAVDTEYARDSVPPPHVAEHDPQLPHDPAQSTGQVADSLVPSLALQAWPPLVAAVVTEYVRDFVPDEAGQDPQLPQDPTQSTGHTFVLQFDDSLAPLLAVQLVPPFAAAVDTEYERVFEPPLQQDQLPHDPAQSMGQAPVLHVWDSLFPSLTLQAAPPFFAVVNTE